MMDLPFQNHPVVRAYGAEELHREFQRLHRPASIDYAPNSRLIWHANGVSMSRMRLLAGRLEAGVTIVTEPAGDVVHLVVARGGQGWARSKNEEFRFRDGAGMVSVSSSSQTLHLGAGFESLCLAIDQDFVMETLVAISGIQQAKPIEFEIALDPRRAHDAELVRLLEFMQKTVDQEGSPLAHPLVLNNLQNAFVTALVLSHPHNLRGLLESDAPTPSARAVERVEAYLDAHANRPISMEELHDVAGMSLRSIQAGFKAKRGCSPMAFLRERRLCLAKERLSAAQPNAQVTEVAYSCGFSHLGRFSRDYAKRFGEKPSETLRRALETRHGIKKSS